MRAGAPAAVTLSGMERITAEPAPTMLQAPIMIDRTAAGYGAASTADGLQCFLQQDVELCHMG